MITQLVPAPTWCPLLGFSTTSSTTSTSTKMSSIDAALAFIKSLSPNDHINIAKIAKQFKYDHSALSKRYRGVTRSRHTQYQNQRNLNNQQKKSLVKYIDHLYARGLPPSKHIIRNFTQEIYQKKIGKE